jgi:ankyrin repeat protein
MDARDGKCAADIALKKGSDAIAALFSGKAIKSRDATGDTILHYAAQLGDTAEITQLLKLGADKKVVNTAGETPAEIAIRWSHPEAAKLLK